MRAEMRDLVVPSRPGKIDVLGADGPPVMVREESSVLVSVPGRRSSQAANAA